MTRLGQHPGGYVIEHDADPSERLGRAYLRNVRFTFQEVAEDPEDSSLVMDSIADSMSTKSSSSEGC